MLCSAAACGGEHAIGAPARPGPALVGLGLLQRGKDLPEEVQACLALFGLQLRYVRSRGRWCPSALAARNWICCGPYMHSRSAFGERPAPNCCIAVDERAV